MFVLFLKPKKGFKFESYEHVEDIKAAKHVRCKYVSC